MHKTSYNRLLAETLSENEVPEVTAETDQTTNDNSKKRAGLSPDETQKVFMRNIIIFTSIGLAIVLYFAVTAMTEMYIQKSSILYATYITNKVERA